MPRRVLTVQARSIVLLSLLTLYVGAGCAPEVRVSPGRTCTTSADCTTDEVCRDSVCVERPPSEDAGRGTVRRDGGPARDAAEGPWTPSDEEVCGNGRDDDGDGEVDEQCGCDPGTHQECYGGPPRAAGRGICTMGSQSCAGSGEFGDWAACTGWVPPAEETCDGVDNNCDGTADEGCSCASGTMRDCYGGPPGTAGVGLCMMGSQLCTDGEWGPCTGAVLPGTETCDSGDNDCDGTEDEGCSCAPGTTRACYETPSGIPGTGTPGLGICHNGVSTCDPLAAGGSAYGPCVGAVTAVPEICANGIDDDCDGMVDEGCVPPVVDCTVADVLFLVDVTGSMSQEIAQIRARLADTIIPGLAAEISDVRFAVASFGDFPVGSYGSGTDVPFRLLSAVTSSVSATQSAVNSLVATGGGDGPESQVEALYQSATGAGISPWVPTASCGPGADGYPCFRPGATPIILLFTDAEFHNGPGGSAGYSGVTGDHSYAQAVSALNAIDAKVLGLMSGAPAAANLRSIATDTGAVASDGTPIVFDIGATGASLGTDVVRAVQTLCR